MTDKDPTPADTMKASMDASAAAIQAEKEKQQKAYEARKKELRAMSGPEREALTIMLLEDAVQLLFALNRKIDMIGGAYLQEKQNLIQMPQVKVVQ